MNRTIAALFIGCSLLTAPSFASADGVKTQRVHFEAGTSGASLEGSIKGYETMQYMIGAKAGQVMDVTLSTQSTSTYFNVFEPGKMPGKDGALFIGDTGGNHFNGKLPSSGDYMIQVYLYRNAARAGETSGFDVDVSINAVKVSGDEGQVDAMVPGTEFNATGDIPCARNAGQPMAQCKFGVKREGNGNGAITVFWPDGGNRVIFFEMNTPMSYDESEADAGAKMTVGQKSDLYTVSIGDMRFEIPAAVMEGG